MSISKSKVCILQGNKLSEEGFSEISSAIAEQLF